MVFMAMNGTAFPAVPPNHVENGRLFHGFRKGIYMYPCDEQEKDRMDIFHNLFFVARHGQLHSTTFIPNYAPLRILDLGTFSGAWAIDMADKYPDAEVVGIDLVNILPEQIPPNVRFQIPRDFESPWFLGEDTWDLIHLRMGYGSISSWSEMYHKIFCHLKPGYGHFEQVEIDLRPHCDDGTLPYQPVGRWYDYLEGATVLASRSIRYQENTKQLLEAQGFVDIHTQVIQLPLNSWPSDPHLKMIGKWYNLGLTEGLEAISLGPLTRAFRWPADNVRRLVGDVKSAICNEKHHIYNNMHIVTARKPALT